MVTRSTVSFSPASSSLTTADMDSCRRSEYVPARNGPAVSNLVYMRNTNAFVITPSCSRMLAMRRVDEPCGMTTSTAAPGLPGGFNWRDSQMPPTPATSTTAATTATAMTTHRRRRGAGAVSGGAASTTSTSAMRVQPGLQHHRGGNLVDHPPAGVGLHPQRYEIAVRAHRRQALVPQLDRDRQHLGQRLGLGPRRARGRAVAPVERQRQTDDHPLGPELVDHRADRSAVAVVVTAAVHDPLARR